MVLVGVVARPQGHRGEVIVHPETDFPEARFAVGATLYRHRADGPEAVVVTASRMHQGRPVVRFGGVETMNDAETLRGVELRVPAQALHPLPEGRYYRHDLVGCDVVTVGGRIVGPVRRLDGPDGDRLVIGEGRAEVLVPLAEPIVVSIDVAKRRIVIDPPEGLLDLNAPEADEQR